jgi:hypothetical protein
MHFFHASCNNKNCGFNTELLVLANLYARYIQPHHMYLCFLDASVSFCNFQEMIYHCMVDAHKQKVATAASRSHAAPPLAGRHVGCPHTQASST